MNYHTWNLKFNEGEGENMKKIKTYSANDVFWSFVAGMVLGAFLMMMHLVSLWS